MDNGFFEIRSELLRLKPGHLLTLLMTQGMERCVLKGNSECPFFLKHKKYGFCVSELLRYGCQEGKEESDPLMPV